MVKLPEIHIDLDQLNDSELVRLCQWVGIEASRSWPRKLLVHTLENFEASDFEDPIDKYRYRLSEWLKMHWKRIRMQMDKKVCPDCYLCRDLQVLECYNDNRRKIEGR